jgi:YVTN family beta-propeller protein
MNTRGFAGLLTVVVGGLLSLASLAHAAPFAYVTQPQFGSVAVVDTATNAVVATVPVGFNPFGVAVHPSGAHVYVGNTDENTVSVIRVTDNTVVATVPVEIGPAGLAVHPDGSRLYVANEASGTVSVIDTATNAAVSVAVGTGPRGIAVNPAGTRVYVANNVSGDVSVIDTASLAVTTVPVGQRLVGVAVDPAGARVYVTDAMGNRVWVLDAAASTLGSVTMAPMTNPFGVAVHPDGSRVYVATGAGTIAVIATATNAVVATPLAAPGLFGIAVAPSGGRVYAVNQGANALFVLDTASLAVTQVAVEGEPNSFGAFITPSATVCDTTALEEALAAAQAQVAALQGASQALIAEKGRLQADLTTVRATIDSFVDKLFGEGVDGKVAAAARLVALDELDAARAKAARSWRVRHAQKSFEEGDRAMRRRDWRRAVHEYREVHAIVKWILGHWHGGAEGPTTVVSGPAPAGPGSVGSAPEGCDTSALEQALAAALRQVASLQAANQSLTAENTRLASDLALARAILTSFVRRLFGEGTDGNVAAAARDAALAELTAAQKAAPHDRRLRLAQHSFDRGQHALRTHEWGRAVHEFRQTHEVCERILHGHRHGRR